MDPASTAALVTLLTFFVAALGACLGSFLNVCIYRIPREMSVVRPRSHCPACGHQIPALLNIPLVSWCLLGGRCRFCRAPISARYVLVEALSAVLFVLVWFKFAAAAIDPAWAGRAAQAARSAVVPWPAGGLLGLVPFDDPLLLLVYGLAVFGLLLGTFVDIEHMILPNRVTIGGMILGIVFSLAIPALHDTASRLTALIRGATGLVVGFGLLWFVAEAGSRIFRKEAMGFGDVKLMGAIGAFFGWRAVLFTLIASSFAGSIVGVSLVVAGRRQMQGRIPYGPFLAVGALVWLFWGPRLWHAYRHWLLPLGGD
jgi:leader peptidase (prepilin peptidase)/N-methyltransferase